VPLWVQRPALPWKVLLLQQRTYLLEVVRKAVRTFLPQAECLDGPSGLGSSGPSSLFAGRRPETYEGLASNVLCWKVSLDLEKP